MALLTLSMSFTLSMVFLVVVMLNQILSSSASVYTPATSPISTVLSCLELGPEHQPHLSSKLASSAVCM